MLRIFLISVISFFSAQTAFATMLLTQPVNVPQDIKAWALQLKTSAQTQLLRVKEKVIPNAVLLSGLRTY